MKMIHLYVGKWRITAMSARDKDYIDLVAPGHLTVRKNGMGQFCFGAIEAEIDCRVERIGESAQLAFSFVGWDEGDDVSGRGWATVEGNKMSGWFGFVNDRLNRATDSRRNGASDKGLKRGFGPFIHSADFTSFRERVF